MSSCCSRLGQNIREELWSYCALAGILFFNTSIVLLVYAYKRATRFPLVVEVFGIALLVLGVFSTLASWIVHRHQRHKKRCFCLPCYSRCFRGRGGAAVAAMENPNPSSASSVRKGQSCKGNGRLARDGDEGETISGSGNSRRPFSTPEFRRYAEFVSQKTVGVERGGRRTNHDSPRSSRSVYPGPGDGKPATAFVNPRMYVDMPVLY